MRQSKVFFNVQKSAVAKYVEYFTQPEKELTSLHDIFPNTTTLSESIIKFHTELCDEMEKNKIEFIGIKILSPSAESARIFKSAQPICTPLFSNMIAVEELSIQRQRLQYVEPAICVTLSEEIKRGCTMESVPSQCSSFTPAIEFTGTRYPFFCPSLGALACDLGMCAAIVKGNNNIQLNTRNRNNFTNYQFVITLNEEPIQVGAPKYCLGSPFSAVCAAVSYAYKLNRPLKRNHIVLCSALSHRKPVQRGKYTMNWGLFGEFSCVLNEEAIHEIALDYRQRKK